MSEPKTKQPSQLHSLLLNVVIPVIILTVFSKEKYLGPLWGMVVALLFPISYGLHTLIKERRTDFISILGIVSVLLTGVFSLMKLPPEWIACKEAAIPLIIGIVVVVSLKTPWPLIKKLMMSKTLFDVDLIHEKLRENNNEAKFEKRLVGLTWGLASSFFLSAVLNYALAKIVLKSEPGTEAFAAEVGRMTGLSYIVVMLPSLAVMICVLIALIKTLTGLTGMKMDDMLSAEMRAKAEEQDKKKNNKPE